MKDVLKNSSPTNPALPRSKTAGSQTEFPEDEINLP
jgi:hypothetical protein